MTQKCIYGCGLEAQFGPEEKRRCADNVSKCPAVKKRIAEKAKGKAYRLGKKNKNPNLHKGKTYEDIYGIDRAKEQRQNISKSLKGIPWKQKMTKESMIAYSLKQSEAIKKRYAEGWMPKAGRCEKISYTSPGAGQMKVDGTWELEVAKFLDKLGVKWKRNKSRFAYNFEGKDRFYTPDFYLEDRDLYIEVKGYETEKDRSKWSQFPHKMLVLKKNEIAAIKNGTYVLE